MRFIRLAAVAVACAVLTAHAADDPLARVKKLEGAWMVVDEKGNVTEQVASVFRVTSNGHSVQEIMFPGTDHEMVNMYYRDVDEVRVTHYCAGGNQPTMRLVPSAKPGVVQLEFVDITNMATMNDEHMHEGQYQWIDDDHLKTEWRSFTNGRASGAMRFEMVRKR
jgi:hypothetical protein